MRIEFGGRAPKVTDSAWIAPGTVLLGGVTVGDEVSIWFGAVVRADNDRIEIGSRTNIQDGCVIHVDPGHPVVIGKGVSVGHRAVLHGCTVGDDVLIGMGAIVMNGAHIGQGSIVGAGAVVSADTAVPARSVVLGVPGKVRATVSDDQLQETRRNAANYVALAAAGRGG